MIRRHIRFLCIACTMITLYASANSQSEATMDNHQNSENNASTSSCPSFLNHDYRLLHNTETLNLCSLYTGKPMLIVNTASHCGFTSQFGDLETLYKKYADSGLTVVGFASNDFMQETKDEAKSAGICYENYGVTFTMFATTKVRGKAANPTFQHLATQTKKPSWNFNKYLITDQGKTIAHFGSRMKPLGSELEKQLHTALTEHNKL